MEKIIQIILLFVSIVTATVRATALADNAASLDGDPDIVTLTDAFAPGLAFTGTGTYAFNSSLGTYVSTVPLELKMAGGGFAISWTLPVVAAQQSLTGGTSSTPRLGGNPYPFMIVDFELLRSKQSYLQIAPEVSYPVDSTGAPGAFSVNGFVGGRLRLGDWLLEGISLLGSTISYQGQSTINSFGTFIPSINSILFASSLIKFSRILGDRLLLGVELEWSHSSGVTGNILDVATGGTKPFTSEPPSDIFPIGPVLSLKISRRSYLNFSTLATFGDLTTSQNQLAFSLGWSIFL